VDVSVTVPVKQMNEFIHDRIQPDQHTHTHTPASGLNVLNQQQQSTIGHCFISAQRIAFGIVRRFAYREREGGGVGGASTGLGARLRLRPYV